jgi:predicted nucleic acid-binding protein
MTVVCDASPLIFLAKLDRLDLIARLLGPEVVVVDCVAREVTDIDRAGELERARLVAFLASVTVVPSTETAFAAGRLSTCDRQTLTYDIRQRPDFLLVDERLMRRIADEQGIATIGTLGLLAAAVKHGHLSAADAVRDLDLAVSRQGFRISVALYQRFRQEMGA